ncbi:MAG: hypothetical protein ACT4OK_05415 [Gemmobacter sp.]
MIDEITFAPPDDNKFQLLLSRATKGLVPVFGVALETAQIRLRRAFPSHRPELTRDGGQVVLAMAEAWKAGNPVRPWLYVSGGEYIIADDYHWLALIEKYEVESFSAQVLGEPLTEGLLDKVGPLPIARVRSLLGIEPK